MWLNFDPESMAAYYAEGALNDADFDAEDEPESIRCKFCRKRGFHWDSTSKGWRLFTETGKMHSCKNGKSPKFRIGGKVYGL